MDKNLEQTGKSDTVFQAENERLRQRIAELEQKIKQESRGTQLDKSESRIFRLVKEKDRTLMQYAEELEEKNRELRKTGDNLDEANAKLINAMAVLRLYELIFDNEPAGILGLDTSGLIMKFNSSAIRVFGVELHTSYLRPLATLRLEGKDGPVNLQAMFDVAMTGEQQECVVARENASELHISAYRLEDENGVRGVIFRFCDDA